MSLDDQRLPLFLRRGHARVRLDGAGFPPEFDLERPMGFGIRMAQDLVERAGGRLRIAHTEGGVVAEISVPAVA